MPVFRIRGRITGASFGALLSPVEVFAADLDSSEPELRFRQIGVPNDGSFDLGPCRSGNYLVTALALSTQGPFLARRNVRLGDQDVISLSLALQPPGEVTGVVHRDGIGPDPAPPLPPLRISLEPLEPIPLQFAPQTVRNDGTFTLPWIPAGRFRLRISGPPEIYLSSVLIGGQDATNGFDVNSSQVALDVRIRSNTGR